MEKNAKKMRKNAFFDTHRDTFGNLIGDFHKSVHAIIRH